MNVLVVDCSSDILAVGVARGLDGSGRQPPKHPYKTPGGHANSAGMVSVSIDAGFRHAERIMGAVNFCLEESGITAGELNLLACASGPGSFTGLRIAMSTIKGMALGLGLPFVAVPTLDAMAEECRGVSPVVVPLLDAKRSQFYFGVYEAGRRVSGPHDDTRESLLAMVSGYPELLFAGPDAWMVEDLCAGRPGWKLGRYLRKSPVAAIAALAARIFEESGPSPSDASPSYLRASDAEEMAAREAAAARETQGGALDTQGGALDTQGGALNTQGGAK